jgi:tetratricopeptide (TPR) repeat protein
VRFSAACVALVACAPNRGQVYERGMAEADRAEVEGRYAEAARDFDAAAGSALVARDRVHAIYLAALMYEKDGDQTSARERYRRLSRASPAAEDSAAAAYKEADMDIARGDAKGGWQEMEAMLLRFPDDGFAKPALHRLLRHVDEAAGPEGALAYLRALTPALEPTERAEEVAYETAARLEALGRLEEARDAFLRTATRWPYPTGALWDDALYRAAEIDERLGRPEAALADLNLMLSKQEVAILVGSYTRPRYPEAAMLAARICRDDLHDAERARKLFHEAYANFPSWGMRDEALWLEADLSKTEGRGSEECGTLEKLVREFPDSRYVPCAVLRCKAVTRPSESRAPLRCHGYIEGAAAPRAGLTHGTSP